MATIQLFEGKPEYDWQQVLGAAFAGGSLTGGGTEVVLTLGDIVVTFTGVDLVTSGARLFDSGDISAISFSQGGVPLGLADGYTSLIPAFRVQAALDVFTGSPTQQQILDAFGDMFYQEPTTLLGSDAEDFLQHSGTYETISHGGGGNDTIMTGFLGGEAHGDAGNDTIFGSATGDDTIDGGADDDTIHLTAGTDELIGGDGVDTVVLSGTEADYALSTVAGKLVVTWSGGVTTLSGFETVQIGANSYDFAWLLSGEPEFVTGAELASDENTLFVANIVATDPNLATETLTYSIIGGADGGFFEITTSGALSFKSFDYYPAPDYEDPRDTDGNNVYEVTVRVDDGAGHTEDRTFEVTINNLNSFSIFGTAGNDLIDATHTVPGQPFTTNEGDYVAGQGGDDTIATGDGNDTIVGGEGDDAIDGGNGDDGVSYRNEGGSQGVVVNLSDRNLDTGNGDIVTIAAHTARDTFGDTDSLTNVENADGTDHDDIFIGTDVVNKFQGFGGNDIVLGGTRDDFLNAGSGNDYFDGAGNENGDQDADVLEYWNNGEAGRVQGITVTMTGDNAGTVIDNWGDTDTFVNVETVAGSEFADSFTGSNDNDRFVGNDGADSFDGQGGDDDTVDYYWEQGGQQSHGILANLSGDTVDGLSVENSATYNLAAGQVVDTFGNIDTAVSIEHITGTSSQDLFVGGDGRNMFEANQGNDVMIGNGGDDEFVGDAGADYVDGGSGNDQINYRDETKGFKTLPGSHGAIVNLSDETLTGVSVAGVAMTDVAAHTAIDTHGETDTLISIERVRGSEYDDLIVGNNDENELQGNEGNDTLIGGGADDYGADFFQGGRGNDTMIGGAHENEFNRVQYAGETDWGSEDVGTHGVIVNLSNTALLGVSVDGIATTDVAGGTAIDSYGDTDTLVRIQNVDGTRFDDIIVGNGLSNDVDARDGNDYVDGGDGDDQLRGGDGNDTLIGGDGNNDLRGDAGNDTIVGGNNDDWMVGGAGSDSFNGNGGWNNIVYIDENGTQGVVFDWTTGTATDSYGDTDTFSNIGSVHGTNFADTLTGNEDDNTFHGYGGNDTIIGGGGRDTVHFHGEEFNGGPAGVTVILDDGTGTSEIHGYAIDGYGNTDDLTSIEDAEGTNYNDSISGSNEDNYLGGLQGNDTILGRDGNDELDGGAGNDELDGGDGEDHLRGGDGDDTLVGGGEDNFEADFFQGGRGNDTIIGGANENEHNRVEYAGEVDWNDNDPGTHGVIVNLSGAALEGVSVAGIGTTDVAAGTAIDAYGDTDTLTRIQNVTGTMHDDLIVGGDDRNNLEGRDGNDTLVGGGGEDEMQGGAGNDTLIGGGADDFNADFFVGGQGNDTLIGGEHDNEFNRVQYAGETDWGPDDQPRGDHGVIVNLSAATLMGVSVADVATTDVAAGTAIDAFGDTDTLIRIQNADGTQYQDLIVGGDENNDFDGRGGDDTLVGGGGEDQFRGGAGNDTLIGGGADDFNADFFVGGQGDDTLIGGEHDDEFNRVQYAGETDWGPDDQPRGDHGIILNLSATTLTGVSVAGIATTDVASGTAIDSFGDTDTLIRIQNADGTQYDDLMVGNDLHNHFDGRAGNDTMHGGAGGDGLLGGAGNDTIYGEDGGDYINAGFGVDTVVGGDSQDWDTLGFGWGQATEPGDGIAVVFDTTGVAGGGTATGAYSEGEDDDGNPNHGTANVTFSGIEHVEGTSGDDSFTVGAGFVASSYGAFVWPDGRGTGLVDVSGGGDSDSFVDSSDATPDGASGGAMIVSYDGDKWSKPDFDGHLWGTQAGEHGVAVNLSGSAQTATDFDLNDGSPLIDLEVAASSGFDLYGDIDSFSGVQAVWLTGANDWFWANDNRDTFVGGAEGDDHLFGGAGDDTFFAGSGNDVVVGGDGHDTVRYDWHDAAPIGIFVNYSGADYTFPGGYFVANGNIRDTWGNADTVSGVEEIIGSQFRDYVIGGSTLSIIRGEGGSDTLLGGAGSQSIYGGDGDDEIQGGYGTNSDVGDYLDGGDGYDTIAGDRGDDEIHGGQGADTLNGNQGNDTIHGDEMADRIIGHSGNDTMYGGDGDDTFIGGSGNDVMDGGTGDAFYDGGGTKGNGIDIDIVDYAEELSSGADADSPAPTGVGVIVNLSASEIVVGATTVAGGTAIDRYGATDTLTEIEGATGTQYADTLVGDDEGNSFAGNDGNDTIYGNGGNDAINAGGDADTVYGGDGNDTIDGHAGNDTLYGEAGNDTMQGGNGDDDITGGAGNDTIEGYNGTDTVRFSGNRADYLVETIVGGVRITDLRADQDGIDTVKEVEFFAFADGTVDQAGLFNVEPEAGDDSLSGSEDTPVVTAAADLLDNDEDANAGQTLTISSVGGATHGTVELVEGNVVFTPDADYSGTASYSYTVEDGAGGSDTATVTIDIAPVADAPSLAIGPHAYGDFWAPVGAVQSVEQNTTGMPHAGTAAALADGGYAIAWTTPMGGSDYSAFVRVFDADGTPRTIDIHLEDSPGNPSYPTITGLADGGFVVAWYALGHSEDAGGYGVYGQRFDADGNTVGGEFAIANSAAFYETNPQLTALSDGGFAVAWYQELSAGGFPTDNGTWVKTYDALGAETNTYHVSGGGSPSISGTADGGVVVAYHVGESFANSVRAMAFDASGAAIGGELNVAPSPGYALYPAVAALTDGGYVVTWADYAGPSYDIHARVVDASGAAGAEFVVGDTDLNQVGATVTALTDGTFVIAWTSTNQDGSGLGVVAQHFAADGTPIGDQQIVPAATNGNQQVGYDMTEVDHGVVQLADGRLLVTWMDGSTADPTLLARTFAAGTAGAGPGVGLEDGVITLPTITAALNDTDGSETLSLRLSGFPAGTTFSVGSLDSGSGDWVITSAAAIADLATTPLTATPPANYNGSFSLTVSAVATDSATLSTGAAADTEISTASFTVYVQSVDDVGTLVDANAADNTIAEGVAGGTVVGITASAPDPDGATVTYSLSSNPGGLFAIDENTGVVTTAAAIDYETTGGSVTIEVTATSSDGSVTSEDFTVGITDSDDAPDAANTTVTVLEDGTHVFSTGDFPWSDDDAGSVLTSVTLYTAPANGTLSFDGVALDADAIGAGYQVSAADLAAGKLTFTPAADANGDDYASLSYAVSTVVDTGLVSAWSFEGNGTDITYNTNDVALNGGAGYATGLHGQAADLDGGAGTYVQEIGDSHASDFGTDDFSVSVWFKSDDGSGREQTLIEDFNGAGGPGWTLTYRFNSNLQFFSSGAGPQFNADTGPINDGDWHQAVVTRSGNQFSLYFDGQLVSTTTSSEAIAGGPNSLLIGARNAVDGRNFTLDGQIDDVSIWSRGLTASEVADQWNDGDGVAVAAGPTPQLSAPATLTIDVTPVNDAPVISSNGGGESAGVNVAEGTTTVATVVAGDVDSAVVTYTIAGGADAARFAIDATTGALTFVSAPDYETPTDADGDNVYEVTVSASDGSLSDTQTISVTVTDGAGVTINGTAAAETIDATHTPAGQPFVTEEGDTIFGNGGNDTIWGLGGNDLINGGIGNDTMRGGTGNDTYVVDAAGDVIIENAGEGTDTVQSSVTHTLAAEVENLTLTGTGNINGIGNAGNNTLTGNSGNNTLNGGLGADVMAGGAGNDIYVVDDAADTVTEATSEGTDLVQAAVSYTLSANVENLTLTGTANTNGTGNAENNTVTGNAGNNVLAGGGGTDILIGGGGNDTYIVDDLADVVTEGTNAGADTVQYGGTGGYTLGTNVENLVLGADATSGTGNTLANTITGNASDNTLSGGSGADTLIGLDGNDTYIVDNAGDATVEAVGGGHDTVQSSVTYTLGAEVEDLTLTGTGAISGTGNELGNLITGNSGANILNGGAGDDILVGGAGNDTYVVDSLGDTVDEASNSGAGTDTVQSAISFDLGAATVLGDVERLTLTGTANINGTGNALANVLTGNSGNNTLDGGTGADTLAGGLGDDTYVTDGGDTISEAADAGNDTVRSSVNYTLGANLENLVLLGAATTGTGNTLNNTITGNALANILSGGTGDDILVGGLGDDTYVADSAADQTVEAADEGTDLVQASVTYTLGANVENLTLTGTTAINGTGNDLANVILGNTASNTLSGGGGNDTLNGGAGSDSLSGGTGDDTYIVDNVGDAVTETAGEGTDLVQSSVSYSLSADVENLTLTGTSNINATGNTGANTLTGNIGANILTGGLGADLMIGGAGNDTYVVDDAGDVVDEFNAGGAGVDTVQSSISFSLADGAHVLGEVERLTLTGLTNINATGNAAANILTGNSGANVLDGGAGADTMIGGLGNDTYIADIVGDVVTEAASAGTDTVIFNGNAGNFILAANVENLTLGGAAAIDGTGNTLANVLIGNSASNILSGGGGNDTLNGGAGADTLIGGAANDTYIVDNAGDHVDEATGGSGVDTVQSSVTFSLLTDGVHVSGSVENLILTGTGSIIGTGNALDNALQGNSGANTLFGGAGDDTLSGNGGNDTLIGGTGHDDLFGGAGNDTFDFNVADFGGAGGSVAQHSDEIFDYIGGEDKIDLSGLLDDALAMMGGNANSILRASMVGSDMVVEVNESAVLDGSPVQQNWGEAFTIKDVADPEAVSFVFGGQTWHYEGGMFGL